METEFVHRDLLQQLKILRKSLAQTCRRTGWHLVSKKAIYSSIKDCNSENKKSLTQNCCVKLETTTPQVTTITSNHEVTTQGLTQPVFGGFWSIHMPGIQSEQCVLKVLLIQDSPTESCGSPENKSNPRRDFFAVPKTKTFPRRLNILRQYLFKKLELIIEYRNHLLEGCVPLAP